jgi:hypothetical protein
MEPKFQTSFIPQKPVTGDVHPVSHTGSTFAVVPFVAGLLFVGSLVAAGGAYFYSIQLEKQIAGKAESLTQIESKLDTPVFDELRLASQQMKAVRSLLEKHVATSQIFAFLEQNILPTTQLDSFNMRFNDKGQPEVLVKSQIQSYIQAVRQAQVLKESPLVISVRFGDLSLTQNGTVQTDFTIVFDPKVSSYAQSITSLSLATPQ